MTAGNLLGAWTYRSFKNDPTLVNDDPQKALALFFAEGVIEVQSFDNNVLKGTLSWSGNVQMRMSGRLYAAEGISPATLVMTGIGIEGLQTQGWVYQYQGYLVPSWPGGVDQRRAIVGSVTRTIQHGNSPGGYVASFIMVQQ